MHDHAERDAELDSAAAPQRRTATPVGHGAAQVMRLQRAAGNAAVAGLLQPTAQRQVHIGEMDSTVTTAGAGSPAAAGGSGIEGISSQGGVITIDGAMVTVNAPVVRTTGILQANTVIAQNVVGSNYTPGAGNVM